MTCVPSLVTVYGQGRTSGAFFPSAMVESNISYGRLIHQFGAAWSENNKDEGQRPHRLSRNIQCE